MENFNFNFFFFFEKQIIIYFFLSLQVKKYLSKNDNPVFGISHNQDTKYIIVFKYELCCKSCGEEYSENNIKFEWCRKCQVNDLELNFKNWTSNNDKIDNLIQNMQLKINSKWDIVFGWIPYNQFSNIKKINDDFGRIYSAIWKNDLLYYDNLYSKEPIRRLKLRVTLKYSQNIIDEVIFHKLNLNNVIYILFLIIIFNVVG